jgi:organic radical activating enzyme
MSFDNPNFTIITTGGCNSFCSFCTDSMKRKAAPDYMANLVTALAEQLPDHFRQVSISGGEPTLSADLPAILNLVKLSKRFDKVVLTTNGARLAQHIPLLKSTVHHLNVSRHGIGYEANTKVFGTRQIVTDEDLKECAFELNKAGIDVNLNHVYGPDSKLTVEYVLKYLEYAKSVGATSVSFRYDQNENSLEPTYLEKLFSEWVSVREGGCPVCRNHTVLVGGFPVVFKASFAEPSKAIDDVYELVYHITGKLTTDWDGKREFTKAMAASYVERFHADPFQQHSVVTHTVAAPSNAARGQRAVVKPPLVVRAAAPAYPRPAKTRSLSKAAASSVSSSSGGGCGGSFGGGCGSSSSSVAPAPAPSPRKTIAIASQPAVDAGGGCGGMFGFGGGCGK